MSDSIDCSIESVLVGEPMEGSAPFALGWLAIEQTGPYGREALLDSHFPRDIAASLLELLQPYSIRPELIRAPGRHADDHEPSRPRRVFLASSILGGVSLASGVIADPVDLLEFDFAAVAAGSAHEAAACLEADREPVLLVCSHAKRDVCCARYGRPIALALQASETESGRVWECSHLGGHRFAPTAAQLPHGWLHGRLDNASAHAALAAARRGEVELSTLRGRSSLTSPAQVADIAYRRAHEIVGLDSTEVSAGGDELHWFVESAAAPRAAVTLTRSTGRSRPDSCGKPAIEWSAYAAAG